MFLEIFAPKQPPEPIEVSNELRGWAWRSPPVAPLLDDLKLGIWEAASKYCETKRDVYLRRILGIKPKPSQAMLKGKAVHNLMVVLIREFKEELLKEPRTGSELYTSLCLRRDRLIKEVLRKFSLSLDFAPKLASFYNYLALQLSAEYDKVVSEAPRSLRQLISDKILEITSERAVDGARVGLSNWLMIDVYVPPVTIVEIKTGAVREFHRLSIAGYGLAMESSEYVPINHGYLLYVHLNNGIHLLRKLIKLTDEVRREFLEERDRVMELIYSERDPGIPSNCPRSCPFYYYCRGDEDEEADNQ